MNALILAAGLGTRLRPLTDHMPKALVPVAGQPLLQRLIVRLKADGFNHLVINIHHFGDQIIDFLATHNHFDMDIQVSDEREQLLDTGGAIKRALPLFPDQSPVLIHNVDILHNLSLRDFYQQHAAEAEATLLVSQRTTSRYLVFDAATCALRGWTNLATGEVKGHISSTELTAARNTHNSCPDSPSTLQLRAFSGIHIFSPSLLPMMQTDWLDRFSIIDFYLQAAATHHIRGVEVADLRLLDVGKLNTLTEAEHFLS